MDRIIVGTQKVFQSFRDAFKPKPVAESAAAATAASTKRPVDLVSLGGRLSIPRTTDLKAIFNRALRLGSASRTAAEPAAAKSPITNASKVAITIGSATYTVRPVVKDAAGQTRPTPVIPPTPTPVDPTPTPIDPEDDTPTDPQQPDDDHGTPTDDPINDGNTPIDPGLIDDETIPTDPDPSDDATPTDPVPTDDGPSPIDPDPTDDVSPPTDPEVDPPDGTITNPDEPTPDEPDADQPSSGDVNPDGSVTPHDPLMPTDDGIPNDGSSPGTDIPPAEPDAPADEPQWDSGPADPSHAAPATPEGLPATETTEEPVTNDSGTPTDGPGDSTDSGTTPPADETPIDPLTVAPPPATESSGDGPTVLAEGIDNGASDPDVADL